MRESFIFYKSFYESIKELDPIDQAKIYNAIFKYQFEQEKLELNGISKIIFTLILPQLEANNKRYENGKKGGAPKGNKNALKTTKKQPKNNQELTKKQPNVNENENENENVNVNDNVINNNKSGKILEIINYLNQPDTEKPIRSFKGSTKDTKSKISARLDEGFTIDDFKDVIFYKYNQWVKNPVEFNNGVMSDTYYRPDTLFSSKNFENYLQEYKEKSK